MQSTYNTFAIKVVCNNVLDGFSLTVAITNFTLNICTLVSKLHSEYGSTYGCLKLYFRCLQHNFIFTAQRQQTVG